MPLSFRKLYRDNNNNGINPESGQAQLFYSANPIPLDHPFLNSPIVARINKSSGLSVAVPVVLEDNRRTDSKKCTRFIFPSHRYSKSRYWQWQAKLVVLPC
ncbi:hypothetical protein SK128_022421 [Halocaridina rubra]|uniref:Uncharacterized protein n=1 Tax=Halocaridina rubra TaxID=373956 RepID=A0AAN8WN75_HALRR